MKHKLRRPLQKEVSGVWQTLAVISPPGDTNLVGCKLADHSRPADLEPRDRLSRHPAPIFPWRHAVSPLRIRVMGLVTATLESGVNTAPRRTCGAQSCVPASETRASPWPGSTASKCAVLRRGSPGNGCRLWAAPNNYRVKEGPFSTNTQRTPNHATPNSKARGMACSPARGSRRRRS